MSRPRGPRVVIAGLIAAALPIAAAACDRASSSPELEWYDETRPLYSRIPVTVRFAPASASAAAEAWTYLESIDDVFNSYRTDSEVGAINRAGIGQAQVAVSAEMEAALRFSADLHQRTDGAFDITVAPLVRLWSSAAKDNRLPTPEAIEAARREVGGGDLNVATRSVSIGGNGRRALDFGGVIKGIAADRAAAILLAAGATSVFVQVGNETVALGPSRAGRRMELAIEDPSGNGALLELRVRDLGGGLSATTSSNAKQPRVIDGVATYHIIDPRTGMPAPVRTLSATVVFPEPGRAGLADGLATAIAVLGPERGLEVVAEAGGDALVLVEGDRPGAPRRLQTAGFARFVAPR